MAHDYDRGVLMHGLLQIGTELSDFQMVTDASVVVRYRKSNPLLVDIMAQGDVIEVLRGFSVVRDLLIKVVRTGETVGVDGSTIMTRGIDSIKIERFVKDDYMSLDLPLRGLQHAVDLIEDMVPDPDAVLQEQMDKFLEDLPDC